MPPAEDRRRRIADAVIRTLADRGSRGLTHRAVDEAAGLPTGSTSYYFRTRSDLLACAVPRLAELDAVAVRADPAGDARQALARVLAQARDAQGRVRTLARYELVLEAARRPDLQAAMARGTEQLLNTIRGLFPELDDADVRARDLLAFIDGLLLADVTTAPGQQRSPDELEAAIARFLDQAAAGFEPRI